MEEREKCNINCSINNLDTKCLQKQFYYFDQKPMMEQMKMFMKKLDLLK
jgi:hypothetical protein